MWKCVCAHMCICECMCVCLGGAGGGGGLIYGISHFFSVCEYVHVCVCSCVWVWSPVRSPSPLQLLSMSSVWLCRRCFFLLTCFCGQMGWGWGCGSSLGGCTCGREEPPFFCLPFLCFYSAACSLHLSLSGMHQSERGGGEGGGDSSLTDRGGAQENKP